MLHRHGGHPARYGVGTQDAGRRGIHAAKCVARMCRAYGAGLVGLRTQPLRAGLNLCRAFGAGSGGWRKLGREAAGGVCAA
jgi:hypothetical protein